MRNIYIVKIENIDHPEKQNGRNYFTTLNKAKALIQSHIDKSPNTWNWKKLNSTMIWECETPAGCISMKIVIAELE